MLHLPGENPPLASSKLKGIIRCFGKCASLISGGKLLEKINTSTRGHVGIQLTAEM